ncbi:AraC family transcriptional regulator [Variovorax sp. 770b2]|uniref:AraC family transcriptional regulator n=1 Tax=Variovorax sp. 770b2 TaxID=1566271 RepID=UPI0008F33C03|nr:AraC family transcriptional regulator [Variovorax sp. 770b2]SFP26614.1 Helix-turn-helix domain-containing protein [Variovorax sp. 770b2]
MTTYSRFLGTDPSDPISHVFSLLRVDHRYPARLDARGDWALSFPGSSHVRFGAAVAGACWLTVGNEAQPLRIEAGDGYLLTRGQVYTVASDLSIRPEDGVELFRRNDSHLHYGTGQGERVSLVSGRFTFDELSTEVLLGVLPPTLHLKAGDGSSEVLKAAIDMLDYETRERRFGASFVTHHVAQIMLVHALRRVAASPEHPPLGWLAALANPHIGAALGLMHAQSDRRWTVGELARAAGMSRSIFALRFKELTGSAPLDYLLHLRMRKAGLALRAGRGNVASIAYEIGYRSESAFSNAFKRVMGASPKDFRAHAAPA